MAGPVKRVVVFIQENKTTDFYFPTLAAWGADVQPYGSLLAQPPEYDQPHDRNAWVHFAMGDYPAVELSVDNDTVIPYYSWLAKSFTFCDHHFGAGTNSTPGHLLAFTGQTPTFRNPPFSGAHPVWDIPTVFRLAERSGRTWGAFVDQDTYPTKFVAELNDSTSHPNIHGPGSFATLAHSGQLPELCYVWSPAGYDEHPPTHPSPGYITNGQALKWQEVDAVVASGAWSETVFMLTWDDWGGYADHVTTPSIETLPDAIHPDGFTAIGGSRIPLIMFGGMVQQGIESQWHSHASIAKTAMDLLGLPHLGVPRVDQAPTLAGRVDTSLSRPEPPAYGTAVTQPSPPRRVPSPTPTAPWAGPLDEPMPAILLNGGGTTPAPTDGTVNPTPPHLPRPYSAQATISQPAKKVSRSSKKSRSTATPATSRRPRRASGTRGTRGKTS